MVDIINASDLASTLRGLLNRKTYFMRVDDSNVIISARYRRHYHSRVSTEKGREGPGWSYDSCPILKAYHNAPNYNKVIIEELSGKDAEVNRTGASISLPKDLLKRRRTYLQSMCTRLESKLEKPIVYVVNCREDY